MKLNLKNFLELKGNVIHLKKVDKEYIDEYWDSLNNCSIEATVFTGTQQVFNRTNIETYLENISSDSSRADFLILTNDMNKMAGEVVINDIDRDNRCASMRIAINKKENFSKGYGTEAMLLAVNYGFGMLNLHRIELEAFPFNERAIHVYEKIGFKREGIRRGGCYFNHKYYDMISMSILEDEFREKYIDGADSMEVFNE